MKYGRSSVFLVVLLLLSPMLGEAKTYYMSPTGATSQDCSTQDEASLAAPRRHWRHVRDCLAPGDTVYLRGGTYPESLESSNYPNIPQGTADRPILIAAYPGDQPPRFKQLSMSGGGHAYLTFQGIEIDGTINGSIPFDTYAMYFADGAHHITVIGGSCKNSGASCIATAWGGSNQRPHHITFRGMDISLAGQNNAGNPPVGHGIYLAGADNLVEDCVIHHNTGGGVQLNANGTDSTPHQVGNDRNIVRNNWMYGNATGPQENQGVQLIIGDDNEIYNNVIVDSPAGAIEIAYRPMQRTKIYNNTIVNTGSMGIGIFDGPINTEVKNNIMWIHNGYGPLYRTGDTGTIVANNLLNTEDPQFVDQGNQDFRLQESSPARNVGQSLSSVPFDYAHTARPQGSAYDIGAYESLEGGGGPPPGPNANPIYLRKTGSDSNSCIDAEDPAPGKAKLTFSGASGALSCMTTAGKMLHIGAGTYSEHISTLDTPITGGTSWANPTVIQALGTDVVTIRAITPNNAILYWTAGSYVVFRNLIFDGNNVTDSSGIVLTGGDHVSFEHCEVKRTASNQFWIQNVSDIDISLCNIHHNTRSPGIRVLGTVSNLTLEDNVITNTVGPAIDVHTLSGGTSTTPTIRRNIIHDTGTDGTSAALALGPSSGAVVVNNAISLNPLGMRVFSGATTWRLLHNTVSNNSSKGIQCDSGAGSGATAGEITNNIAIGNGASAADNLVNNCSANVAGNISSGLPADFFTNPGTGDYTLKATSPARNAGIDLPSVTIDLIGTSRPQGPKWDVGAYEFIEGTEPVIVSGTGL